MTKYRKRRDSNHAAVRDKLRAAGLTVVDYGDAGGDIADLLVHDKQGWHKWVEVKSERAKTHKDELHKHDAFLAIVGGVVAFDADGVLDEYRDVRGDLDVIIAKYDRCPSCNAPDADMHKDWCDVGEFFDIASYLLNCAYGIWRERDRRREVGPPPVRIWQPGEHESWKNAVPVFDGFSTDRRFGDGDVVVDVAGIRWRVVRRHMASNWYEVEAVESADT